MAKETRVWNLDAGMYVSDFHPSTAAAAAADIRTPARPLKTTKAMSEFYRNLDAGMYELDARPSAAAVVAAEDLPRVRPAASAQGGAPSVSPDDVAQPPTTVTRKKSKPETPAERSLLTRAPPIHPSLLFRNDRRFRGGSFDKRGFPCGARINEYTLPMLDREYAEHVTLYTRYNDEMEGYMQELLELDIPPRRFFEWIPALRQYRVDIMGRPFDTGLEPWMQEQLQGYFDAYLERYREKMAQNVDHDDPRAQPAAERKMQEPKQADHITLHLQLHGAQDLWDWCVGEDVPVDPKLLPLLQCLRSGRFEPRPEGYSVRDIAKYIPAPFEVAFVHAEGDRRTILCETRSESQRVSTSVVIHTLGPEGVPMSFQNMCRRVSLSGKLCPFNPANVVSVQQWKRVTQPGDRIYVHAIPIRASEATEATGATEAPEATPSLDDDTVPDCLRPQKLRLYWVNATRNVSTCLRGTHMFWDQSNNTAKFVTSRGTQGNYDGTDLYVACKHVAEGGEEYYTYPSSIMGERAEDLHFRVGGMGLQYTDSGVEARFGDFEAATLQVERDWMFQTEHETLLRFLLPPPSSQLESAMSFSGRLRRYMPLLYTYGNLLRTITGPFNLLAMQNANCCVAGEVVCAEQLLAAQMRQFVGTGGYFDATSLNRTTTLARLARQANRSVRSLLVQCGDPVPAPCIDKFGEEEVVHVQHTGIVCIAQFWRADGYAITGMALLNEEGKWEIIPAPTEALYAKDFLLYVPRSLMVVYTRLNIRHPIRGMMARATPQQDEGESKHDSMGGRYGFEEHAFLLVKYALSPDAHPRLIFSSAVDHRLQLTTGRAMKPMLHSLPFTLGFNSRRFFADDDGCTVVRSAENPFMCPWWLGVDWNRYVVCRVPLSEAPKESDLVLYTARRSASKIWVNETGITPSASSDMGREGTKGVLRLASEVGGSDCMLSRVDVTETDVCDLVENFGVATRLREVQIFVAATPSCAREAACAAAAAVAAEVESSP